MDIAKLKYAAILSFIVSMAVLLYGGQQIKSQVPPYPGKVISAQGELLFDKNDLLSGQDVYQRYGLMDHGSVWGHGTLRGMDFSATTAHLMGEKMREYYAQSQYRRGWAELEDSDKDALSVRVIKEIKTNQYDSGTDVLKLTEAQEWALRELEAYWSEIFEFGDKGYGFLPGTVKTSSERVSISRFFFWTGWVATVKRPGQAYSYTNNWPPDKSLGNEPTPDTFIWSVAGILSLFAGLGLVVYLVHRYKLFYGEPKGVLLAEKLQGMPLTGSQYQAAKFFVVVSLLFILQTLLGGLMAHYTVSPAHFFIPLIGELIPYSWAKSWHLQLAIFWIATTWVGTAIYLAPVIGGKEPKGQSLLVNILFGAILIVAVGSLTGEVLGIKGYLGKIWFWFGHQGWEYLELGRFWQILLFVGLVAWLLIVYRALAGKLTFGHKQEYRALVSYYVFSAILVVLFFGFGFFYGKGSHLTVADYWRWFVVHIWVEGIFEFFGVAVISLFLVILGLVSKKSALTVAYFSAILVFLSGIIGTAHHYFWYGGPALWLALGSVFSSLEPIPLILLVVRAWMEYKSVEEKGKAFAYRWPLLFLTASSVWNFVGAGIFGFVINLPIINYYEHATYLTLNHGHAALFGVYGMLSVALLTFSWRGLVPKEYWSDRLLAIIFWSLNIGLFLMTFGTLLPVGIIQTIDSFTHGFWYARSAAFYNKPVIQTIGTLRVIPDLIIIFGGVIPLFIFLLRSYPRLRKPEIKEGEDVWKRLGISLDE